MTRGPSIESWPARDRAAWRKGFEAGGLFEAAGAGAGWSDAYRLKTKGGYNAWLSWLARNALLDPNVAPSDRVTRERVAAHIAEIRVELAPNSVLARVKEIYDALRVMAPDGDRDWLAQLIRVLSAQARPVRDKLSRLRSTGQLVAVGERLMEEAEAVAGWSARRRAIGYRDGFLIALLAYRPIRLKNLVMMRLGRHLIKASERWQILFSADETKSHRPFEALLPVTLQPRLERYLDFHRPVLLRRKRLASQADATSTHPELDALWVSEIGTQLEYGPLGRRIFLQTRLAFGRGINPHLFRDCAATSIALDNPKHIGDASLVLGHAGLRTTEKHYNHARSLEASRRYAAMLACLSKTLNQDR